MLAIRMQRTGRKGHAQFRVIVQESRLTPTSGKVVFPLGSYNPHTKAVILNKEKAAYYLEHGAQPSTRVAKLLKSEGVKLPDWVKLPADKERTVRNAEKRRSTAPEQPAEEVAEVAPEAAVEAPAETSEEVVAVETPADAPTETPAVEEPAAETEEVETPVAEEAPAEAEVEKAEEAPEAESKTEEPEETKA